jgi:hypothetical protein
MSESEELEKAVESLQDELGYCSDRFGNECKLYQRWDLGLTVTAIVFTLLTAVTGTLEDGRLLPGNSQKILTGVFGAIAVAIQSAVTKFPVQERAKSYRKLRNEMYILQKTSSKTRMSLYKRFSGFFMKSILPTSSYVKSGTSRTSS